MKLLTIVAATLLAAHNPAFAGQAPDQPGGPPQGLGLGIGLVASSANYAGEDGKLMPVPLVSYEGERFYWRGIGGGLRLFELYGLSLDATLSARLGGIEKKDFGVAELAQRGINRALLEDRDNGLDLGLAASWSADFGELELAVKGDATGNSKGYEASLKYGYPLQLGRTRITPHVGVTMMSKKLANYYYGTLDTEVARGVVNYKPGSATVPTVGVDAVHPLSGKWVMLGFLSYKALPKEITNSPLLKKDSKGSATLFLGVSRGF